MKDSYRFQVLLGLLDMILYITVKESIVRMYV